MNYPTIIPLKARIVGTVVEIFWMKWRPIGYYQLKNRIPSKTKQKEFIQRIALNTGLPVSQQYEITSWEV
jgi:hypothetical protein